MSYELWEEMFVVCFDVLYCPNSVSEFFKSKKRPSALGGETYTKEGGQSDLKRQRVLKEGVEPCRNM